MKKIFLLMFSLITYASCFGQVGVNNLNPKAILDISANSVSTPDSNDGLLIPRINKFPAVNPIAEQNSMLVYLTNNLTGTNINGTAKDYNSGFYYWNNNRTDWLSFSGATGTEGWKLDGNNIASSNFIGSTNYIPLLFKVNNQQIGNLNTNGSIVFGFGATSTVNDAVALGRNAKANSQNSVALGYEAETSSNDAVAIGYQSDATGYQSLSLGYQANTTQNFNNAIGYKTISTGYNANSIGIKTEATGQESLALGFSSNPSGGSKTLSSGYQSVAIGRDTQSTGNGAIAFGNSAYSGSNDALAIGSDARAESQNTIAIGKNSRANNNNALAIGYQASALAQNAVSIGPQATNSQSNTIVIGNTYVSKIGGYKNWSNLSDMRFKSNISENVPGLDFITKIKPVTYTINTRKLNTFLGVEFNEANESSEANDIIETGFLAQQVEEVAKDINYNFNGIVRPENIKTQHYSVSYSTFVVPLVKAVQEQQEIIEVQNKEIENLNKDVKSLEERLEKLEMLLEK